MSPITSPHTPIVITTGEPAGIGAEVSLRAALQWQRAHTTPLVLLGDIELLRQTASDMGLNVCFVHEMDAVVGFDHGVEVLRVHHTPLMVPAVAGVLALANAPYVLQLLDAAMTGIARGEYAAMVTAPVQKSIINDAGIAFTGHTEYLAAKTHTEKVVMMLAGGGMRVALASTHIALRQVADAITVASLTRTIQIILDDLKNKFGIERPRLLVTGLNPHAGEGGHMGTEEIDVIAPVIEQFKKNGHDVRGPYPADTLFQPRYLDDADAVLAMYHDQGLSVLKYASFGRGVNITLGLPMIRTSVDHGTALDLAGKNVADEGSMLAAIVAAHEMVLASKKH